MSALPRRLAVAAAAAVALLCVPLPVTAAEHPDPTQRLHDAKAVATADKQQLVDAQAQAATAQDRLTALAATAQQAVDGYTASLAQLRTARATVTAARVALSAATAEATAQQRQVDGFVRAVYMSGGPLSSLAVILDANGPSDVLNRAALFNAVSQSQADMLAQLVRARQQQSAAADAAAVATADVAAQATRADAARRTALASVSSQHAVVTKLANEQADLAKTLAAHESQVAGLARAQAAERVRAKLAAQRALLAASWSRLEAAGEAMPAATAAQEHQVVRWARRQLGVPYSWSGGNRRGPTLGETNRQGNPAGLHTIGFDCSGLTLFAWAHVGFRLDHFTGYQWLEGHHVPLEQLRPGDLVFFAHNTGNPMSIHHVGIYVGHGRMIDAPHTGAHVRYDDVFVPGLIGVVRP